MPQYTVKEAKFIQAKLAGKSATEAAKIAGYSKKSAHISGSKLMKRSHIQEALFFTLEDLGITFQKAVKPITEALEATRVVIIGNGEEAMADVQPDHNVRLKASSMALDLLGLKHGHSVSSPHSIPDTMTPELQAAMKSGDEVELQRAIFRKIT